MDARGDHTAWDNTEAVTLEQSTRGGGRSAPVAWAKRRAVRVREQSPSGGTYQGHEVRWHVPTCLLPPGFLLSPGDAVLDGQGTRWTVLTRELNRLGETLALGCVDLVLALDLRDLITIERAEISYDSAGAPVKEFRQVLYTLPAKVQLVTEEIADQRGMRASLRRYEVTLGAQVPLLDVSEDRMVWTDPAGERAVLDMLELRQPERIDELPVVVAERRPG